MEIPEAVECPFCLDRMQVTDRAGVAWLVCPNGCSTEIEVPVKKPAASETIATPRVRAAGE